RERVRLDQLRWASSQDRVSIFLFYDAQRRVEMNMPHIEFTGDLVGLVDAAAARPAHVELLQRYDIGLAGVDHRGDPGGRQLSVCAQATMNIIGENSRQ